MDEKPRYEARTSWDGKPNLPTDCCKFAVVDLEKGIEVCRVWEEEDVRRLSDLLNGAAPAVSVKPLDWEANPDDPEHSFVANAFGLTYEAGTDVGGLAYWGFFRQMRSRIVQGGVDDAKAAAQAEYEARIRAALA